MFRPPNSLPCQHFLPDSVEISSYFSIISSFLFCISLRSRCSLLRFLSSVFRLPCNFPCQHSLPVSSSLFSAGQPSLRLMLSPLLPTFSAVSYEPAAAPPLSVCHYFTCISCFPNIARCQHRMKICSALPAGACWLHVLPNPILFYCVTCDNCRAWTDVRPTILLLRACRTWRNTLVESFVGKYIYIFYMFCHAVTNSGLRRRNIKLTIIFFACMQNGEEYLNGGISSLRIFFFILSCVC